MSGFASLLKKKFSGKEDIVGMIDAELVQRKSYDFNNIKKSLRKLTKYAELPDDEREEDEFMKLFFDFYLEMYAERARTKGVFHPSGINTACERALFYEFTGEEESDEMMHRHSGQTLRTFDSGTWWHTYIQMLLWKAGILEKSEVRIRSKRRKLSGHADGILRLTKRTLLEIKTMNSFSFARGKLKPFATHEVQAGVYATELEIEQICFLYINKDTSEICIHIVPVNKNLVAGAYDKMNTVLVAVKNDKLPKRTVCKTSSAAPAKVCAYCSLCFSTKF